MDYWDDLDLPDAKPNVALVSGAPNTLDLSSARNHTGSMW